MTGSLITSRLLFVPFNQFVVSEISAQPVNRGVGLLRRANTVHIAFSPSAWFTEPEWRSIIEMDTESHFERFVTLTRQTIAQHGHAVHVCEEPNRPTWAYTMGLTAHLQYELACFGLPDSSSTRFLNQCAGLLTDGLQMLDREPISGIATVPLRLVTLPSEDFMMHVGLLRSLGYMPARFRILQWPDLEGNFPGDPDYKQLLQQLPADLLSPPTVKN